MEKITETLYLGNSQDAYDHLTRGHIMSPIDAVLCVAWDIGWLELPDDPEHVKPFIKVGLVDAPGNSPQAFDLAVAQLDLLQSKGYRTLIHCQAGISRSPTVAAAYLAFKNNWRLDDSINFLASIRSCVDPHRGLKELASEWLRNKRGWA